MQRQVPVLPFHDTLCFVKSLCWRQPYSQCTIPCLGGQTLIYKGAENYFTMTWDIFGEQTLEVIVYSKGSRAE